MENEILKSRITDLVPEAAYDEAGQWLNVTIPADLWLKVAQFLDGECNFKNLFCITCIDWKTHFTMVYHLETPDHKNIVVIKATIADRENPAIESVSSIWRTAEFHEREAYDLFGVKFLNHPDLRRLFLTDDWKGWPLRKDYEDPVNMIKL